MGGIVGDPADPSLPTQRAIPETEVGYKRRQQRALWGKREATEEERAHRRGAEALGAGLDPRSGGNGTVFLTPGPARAARRWAEVKVEPAGCCGAGEMATKVNL